MNDELMRIREGKMRDFQNTTKAPPLKIERLTDIVNLSDTNFSTFIQHEDLPIIVDFWAEWCGPCRMTAQYYPELANKFAGKMRFAKTNVDENQQLAMQFNITGIPHFIVFYRGHIFTQFSGALPKPQMEQYLQQVLDKLSSGHSNNFYT